MSKLFDKLHNTTIDVLVEYLKSDDFMYDDRIQKVEGDLVEEVGEEVAFNSDRSLDRKKLIKSLKLLKIKTN